MFEDMLKHHLAKIAAHEANGGTFVFKAVIRMFPKAYSDDSEQGYWDGLYSTPAKAEAAIAKAQEALAPESAWVSDQDGSSTWTDEDGWEYSAYISRERVDPL